MDKFTIGVIVLTIASLGFGYTFGSPDTSNWFYLLFVVLYYFGLVAVYTGSQVVGEGSE